jgi:hypothetical protein
LLGVTTSLVKDTIGHDRVQNSIIVHGILHDLAYNSPQEMHELRFRFHSGTRECCPRVTVKPEGSISNEKGIDKIGEEWGRGGERRAPT